MSFRAERTVLGSQQIFSCFPQCTVLFVGYLMEQYIKQIPAIAHNNQKRTKLSELRLWRYLTRIGNCDVTYKFKVSRFKLIVGEWVLSYVRHVKHSEKYAARPRSCNQPRSDTNYFNIHPN